MKPEIDFDLDYSLPEHLIADKPPQKRGTSRLMSIDRKTQSISHCVFTDLPRFFTKGEAVIFNNTRVLNARLLCKTPSGRESEILLVEKIDDYRWKAMVKFSRKFKNGSTVNLGEYNVRILERIDEDMRIVEFDKPIGFEDINRIGVTPIPPYIVKRRIDQNNPAYLKEDSEWYQPVFAKHYGSVASPTASLHFTDEIINSLKRSGVNTGYVTLHIGPGTFKPIDRPLNKFKIHSEWIEVPPETVDLIKQTKSEGKKITAVGTTVIRAVESLTALKPSFEEITPFSGTTSLFIKPGHKFKIIDRIITNFHLPNSTLLLLVYAFAGQDLIKTAYIEAIEKNYRFYSYGDAMIID
jgi:S-adenosylmethionine:tRNA ribosyltransferase-isomerase